MSLTKKVAYGLANLYMGDVASDGGLGTPLTPVLYTKATTPVIQTAAGTKTDFNIEESDTPYFSTTTPGETTLTFSLYGLDAQQLYRFFGGTLTTGGNTATPDTWESPASQVTKEQSIVLQHLQGGHLEIPRASVSVLFVWNFQKAALPQLDFTVTVLTPTKANTSAMKFSQAVYTP